MKLSNLFTIALLIALLAVNSFSAQNLIASVASSPIQGDDPFAGSNEDDSNPFGNPESNNSDPFGNATPVSTTAKSSQEKIANKNRPKIRTTEEIAQNLKKPTAMSFDETAFIEVMDELRDHNEINIVLDQSAQDDSLTEDELITFHIRDTSLATALRLMLAQKNATYVIDDGVMRIISLDVASDPEFFRRRIFDCGELLEKIGRTDSRVGQPISAVYRGGFGGGGRGGIGGGGRGGASGGGVFAIGPQSGLGSANNNTSNVQPAVQAQSPPMSIVPKVTAQQLLKDLIRVSVDPDGWDDTNGDATMTFLGGLMIVTNSQTNLEDIEQLLDELNRAMK